MTSDFLKQQISLSSHSTHSHVFPPFHQVNEPTHLIMCFSCARTSTAFTLCNPSSPSSTLHKPSFTTTASTSTSTSIFPQSFGIYRASSYLPHLVLAHSSKTVSTPFFFIAIHSSFRCKPDIILHRDPTKAHPSLASAQFKGFTSTPQITLGSTRYGAAPTEPLQTEGFFHTVHYFSLFLPNLSVRERFEWKNSCGAEFGALGHGSGMNLIRIKTGEIVAVYADVNFALQKNGEDVFSKGWNGRGVGGRM
jgi:hypothetical protein